MSDRAPLSFDVDSTSAQRAVSVLQTLVAQAQAAVASSTQLQQINAQLTTSYAQQVAEMSRLADQTRNYGGTLAGLVSQLNQLRSAVTSASGGNLFSGYARMLNEAQAVAAQLNTSVEGIDRFISKARQLNITAQDLATGLNRITDALKGQTSAGLNANIMLSAMGVSMSGISPNQPNLVLQRIQETLRQIQDPTLQLQMAQRVMGPAFTAQDTQQLVRQPYIPFWQQQEQNRQANVRAQIDQQQVGIQRMTFERQQRQDELADLTARFTRFGGPLGRAGISDFFANLFTPNTQLLQQYRAIEQRPEAERQRYERPGEIVRQGLERSDLVRAFRNFSTGAYTSNQAEIEARFSKDIDDVGRIQAYITDVKRSWANFVGRYQALKPEELQTALRPEELRERQRAAGEALATNLGETRVQNIVRLQDVLGADPTKLLDIYNRAYTGEGFAPGEGASQFGYAQLRRQRELEDLRRPEAPAQRQAAFQRYLLGLAPGDRARAQFGAEFYRTVTGNEFVPGVGAGAGAAFQELGPRGEPGQALFQERQLGLRQQDIEQTQRIIASQDELREAMGRSRAAAEDANRAFLAFYDAQGRGADTARANAAAEDAVTVAMAQRITQGQALVRQQQQENVVAVQRAADASRYATADPVTRAAYMAASGVDAQIQRAIFAGQLQDPAGGRAPVRNAAGMITGFQNVTLSEPERRQAQQTIEEYRRSLLVQQAGAGAEAAAGQATGIVTATQTSARAAELMRGGFTGQQAAERADAEQKLADAAGKAQAAMEATANATDDQARKEHDVATQALATVQAEQQRLDALMKELDAQRAITQVLEQTRQIMEDTNRTITDMNIGEAFRQAADEFQRLIQPILQAPGGGEARISGVFGVVAGAESGGRPGFGRDIPQRGGPAEGYFQIEPPTWREFAPQAGVELRQYPTALGAPPAVQARVAAVIPLSRWAPGTRQAVLSAYPGATPGMTLGQIAGRAGEPGQPSFTTPATGPQAPGGFTLSNDDIRRLIERGEHLPQGAYGLSNADIDAINQAADQVRAHRATGIARTTQEMREQIDRELQASGARVRLLAGGAGTGAAARIVTRPTGMTDEEWAQRQQQEVRRVIGGQTEQAAGDIAAREEAIRRSQQAQQAYTGTLAEQIARTREATAAAQAHADALKYGGGVANEAALASQHFRENLAKETEELSQQTQALQKQTAAVQASAHAAQFGPQAAQLAGELAPIATEIESLMIKRQTATAQEAADIDKAIEKYQQLGQAIVQNAQAQAQAQAASEAYRQSLQNQQQMAVNALGPFASDLDIRRTQRWMGVAQEFAAHPGLEQTQAGQQRIATTEAADAIDKQTQAMGELRQAAQSTGDAIEEAFTAVVNRSETAGQAVHNLAASLQTIALRTFVIKPFERMMSGLFTDLFGGEPTGTSGGATDKTVFGIAQRLMANEGGGGGGGGAPQGEDLVSRGWHWLFGRNQPTGTGQDGGNAIGQAAGAGGTGTLADQSAGGIAGALNTALMANATPVYVVNWPVSLGGAGVGNTNAAATTGAAGATNDKALADALARQGGQAIANRFPGATVTANGQVIAGPAGTTDGGDTWDVGGGGAPVTTGGGGGAPIVTGGGGTPGGLRTAPAPADIKTGGGSGFNIFDTGGNLVGWTADPNAPLKSGQTMQPATGAASTNLITYPTDQPDLSGFWNTSGMGAGDATTNYVSYGGDGGGDGTRWDVPGSGDTGTPISLGGGPRVSAAYTGSALDTGIQGLGLIGNLFPAVRGASVGAGPGGNINIFSSLMSVLKAVGQTGGGGGRGGGGVGGGGAGGGGAGGDGGGGLFSQIFGHAGGFTGWMTDQILGQGAYQQGGLIGMAGRSLGLWGPGSGGGGDTGGPISLTGGLPSVDLPLDTGVSTGGSWDTGGADIGSASDVTSSGIYALGGISRGGLAALRNTVVEAPTVFRFAQGGRTGLAGEAGGEAILPLKRDGSGRLGVAAGSFGGSSGDNHYHTWNINTPNADSFMRSRNQIEASVNLSIVKARQRNNQ
jgi:hypothetical protein